MRARQLVEDALYDPATVKALCQAFDEAWGSIAHHYSGSKDIEGARVILAASILAVAPFHGTDVDALKNAALQHMALSYRPRSK